MVPIAKYDPDLLWYIEAYFVCTKQDFCLYFSPLYSLKIAVIVLCLSVTELYYVPWRPYVIWYIVFNKAVPWHSGFTKAVLEAIFPLLSLISAMCMAASLCWQHLTMVLIPQLSCLNNLCVPCWQYMAVYSRVLWIYRSHFTLYNSIKTPHSWQVRARFGVSFVSAILIEVLSL